MSVQAEALELLREYVRMTHGFEVGRAYISRRFVDRNDDLAKRAEALFADVERGYRAAVILPAPVAAPPYTVEISIGEPRDAVSTQRGENGQ